MITGNYIEVRTGRLRQPPSGMITSVIICDPSDLSARFVLVCHINYAHNLHTIISSETDLSPFCESSRLIGRHPATGTLIDENFECAIGQPSKSHSKCCREDTARSSQDASNP